MSLRSRLLPAALLAAGLAVSACQKDDAVEPPPPGTEIDTQSFDALVQSVGPTEPAVNATTVTAETSATETRGEELWRCTTQTVDQDHDSGGAAGYSLYSPNASVIYPGSLLQGASLHKATPDVVSVDRAGGNFSIDVIDGNITSSFSVDEVRKSTVTDALNAIVRDATGVVPASFSFSYESIQSKQQLAASMRMSYESFAAQAEGKMSFSTDRAYNRYVVKLEQSYYTMSFDLPRSLDDIFAPGVTPDDLARYTGPGNPVTYISDVTYGRTYYMLVESTSTEDEMSAAISGSFNGVAASVDGEAEVDAMRSLDNLRIKVFGYGGESGSTLQTIGVTDLSALSDLLARASTITSGKPVSYVVRSLYDNSVVSTQLATSYDITNCVPVAPSTFPYTAHWTGEVLDRMGPVGAAYIDTFTTFPEIILIAQDGQRFMRSVLNEVQGPFPVSDLFDGQPLPAGFNGIGAACNISRVEGRPSYESKTIQLIDLTGTQMTYWTGTRFLRVTPVSEMGNNDSPLIGGGMGAIIASSFANENVGSRNRFFFDTQGANYTFFDYATGSPRFADRAYPIGAWGPQDDCPFDAIAAGVAFNLEQKHFTIMFDKAGERYTLYGNLESTGSSGRQFHGTFDL